MQRWFKLFNQHAGKRLWEVRAQDGDPKKGELLIYGPIFSEKIFSWEVAPRELIEEIEALGDIDELWVRINSPGGDAFAGLTINNILRRQKAEVIAHIDGMAASAASVIAMGADRIIMPANSLMMIHKAWTFTLGNADELREQAAALDKVDGAVVASYMQHATVEQSEIDAMLASGDTWLSPEEALEMGLATEIESETEVAASLRDGKIVVNGMEWDADIFTTKPPIPEETPAEPNPVHAAGPKEVTTNQFRDALAEALGFKIKDPPDKDANARKEPTEQTAEPATKEAPQRGRSFYARKVAINRNRLKEMKRNE